MAPQGKLPSRNFIQSTDQALAAAREELAAAAKAHRVEVDADRMTFVVTPALTMLLAPLAGIERYGDDDFEVGAPIHLLVVRSATWDDVPDGSYVVSARHRRRANAGVAIFRDSSGAAVAERELLVRTQKQAEVLFPGIYPPHDPHGPQEIPVVTSYHQWALVGGKWKDAVDCAGWHPYRVVYY